MILTIETSGLRCGVALWDGRLIDFTETVDNLRHNEVLFNRINTLLYRAHVAMKDLSAVAVSSGPGSFTGLRVGMAAAKGLCWTLKIPLIAVPTLEGLAASVPPHLKRVLPLMPARAREVYWCLYEYADGRWNRQGDYSVSDVAAVNEAVQGNVFLCGEGYNRHHAELEALFAGRRLILNEGDSLAPLVISTAQLAAQRFVQADFEDLMKAEPEYFYPFPRTST